MISPGEVVVVGDHRVRCGDLLEGSVEALMAGERADVVYSDPPWGPGHVRYFRTKNGQRGQGEAFDWPTFLRAFCHVTADSLAPTGVAFVEMGLRWTADVREGMRAVGLEERMSWVARYAGGRPCSLQLFSREPLEDHPGELLNRTGVDLVRRALRPYAAPGRVVLDPCTGLGMTARAVLSYEGVRFRGNELVPARLQRTVDDLRARLTKRAVNGLTVERGPKVVSHE